MQDGWPLAGVRHAIGGYRSCKGGVHKQISFRQAAVLEQSTRTKTYFELTSVAEERADMM